MEHNAALTANDLDSGLRELALCVERALGPDDSQRRLGPVWAFRAWAPTDPAPALLTPVLCLVAQGRREVLVGEERHVYDPGRFLLNSVSLPGENAVVDATGERPCLWLSVELDPILVGEVIAESGLFQEPAGGPLRALASVPLDRPLLDAIVRLARFLDSPHGGGYLMSLALREIVFHLLGGSQAARLRQIASLGRGIGPLGEAIEWLRRNFDKPMTLESLARRSGMSPSALQHGFKRVTATSPLQFQKQLRLQEARRLMVYEGMDATRAGYQVGYDDPSYFSREYRRLYGNPPKRHAARVRNEIACAPLSQRIAHGLTDRDCPEG